MLVLIFLYLLPGFLIPAARSCRLSHVDVVIMIDSSTSVTPINFQKMLNFSKDLVDQADIDSGSVQMGVLIYSTDVRPIFKLGQYKTSIETKAAIDEIPYIYGGSNITGALREMHESFFNSAEDRPDIDNMAILLTDEISVVYNTRFMKWERNYNSERSISIQEARAARRKGIKIYSIGN